MEDLKHNLRMKFGLSPHEPTDEQIRKIKELLSTNGNNLADAVSKTCPSYGKYSYAGQDNSDISVLLAQVLAA